MKTSLIAALMVAVLALGLTDLVEAWIAAKEKWQSLHDIEQHLREVAEFDEMVEHYDDRPHHHQADRLDRDGRGHCACGSTRIHPGGLWS